LPNRSPQRSRTQLVVKARIASEHPLLIFDTLPRSNRTDTQLSVAELLESGRAIDYKDLPERLWATTGIRMAAAQAFVEFGYLRNKIAHFAIPRIYAGEATYRFVFEVMEPLLSMFGFGSVIPHAQAWDDALLEGYLQENVARYNVKVHEMTQALIDEAEGT
jgi:hypothetical protein